MKRKQKIMLQGVIEKLFLAKRQKQAVPSSTIRRGLTKEEQSRLAQLQSKKEEKTLTAQKSIPYKEIFADGVCQVTNTYYTKSVRFFDINYQLAQNEDKTDIFDGYCEFLNYFDSSVKFQLTFLNQQVNFNEFSKTIDIPMQSDDFNDIRLEYVTMLKNQLAKGNNGLVKTKYITFGIEAESRKQAKLRLERIEIDILNNFKVLGVAAAPLTGIERLEILHNIFNMDTKEPFHFNYKMISKTGLGTKDFIAPTAFDFRNSSYFKVGRTFGCISYLQIIAPELSDKILAEFLDLEENLIINLHIQSIDQKDAIKSLKMTLSNIQKMKIEEQKKAVRSGYDMDIIPTDIATYGDEAQNLLNELQSRNEKMFKITFLIMNTASSHKRLENVTFQTSGIAQKYNCNLRRMQYLQEQGLMASIPIGLNDTGIERGLTTSSTAIFIPFTTQELFMEGDALYYGLNALSNNMIMVDRKQLKNPNGLILGTPGSGKSFSAKREILNVFLLTNDDIVICDPEAEYFPLVNALNGQVIKISPASKQYINPMDINLNYSEDESPISLKSDFIISLCELIIGGKRRLEGDEITIIDRCVKQIYQKYLVDPMPENMPILGDLYDVIRDQKEPGAEYIATCLEIYVSGSLNLFNNRTNVDITNRIVCFDIKELGKQLKKLGMLIVQDQVWNRVTINRENKKATRYYVDEFHLLLKEEQTAAYSVEIWKRFRKWGGIPTGITQNVKDLLSSREVENIFENSDFIYMLNQAAGDRKILAKTLNISPHQLSYVTHSNAGEGLIFYGNVIIPFVDKYPTDTLSYSIMTTKLEEVGEQAEQKQA